MKVLKSYKEIELDELVLECGETYIQDLDLRVRVYRGAVVIREIQEALKVGGVCKEYKIGWRDYQDGQAAIANYLMDQGIKDLPQLLEMMKGFEYPRDQWYGYAPLDLPGGVFTVYLEELKGVRCFSPFQLKRLKPLKEVPKKWTLKHALRAIACGQFTDLRCKGKYSDDYQYDAAYGYHAGEIKKPLGFIKKIIEDPQGWWTSLQESGEVYLCCHHFDSNDFMLKI